jgi:precorrin-3B methylase
LFGRSFNKREEFWFLQLMSAAAEEEVAAKQSKIAEDISDGDSMVFGLASMFCKRHDAEKYPANIFSDALS